MNQKEKEIIKSLRNGERNVSNIARKLKMPVSTVSESVRKIRKKYIVKHSSLLDYNKIGYMANFFLTIKINAEHRKEFLDFLKSQNCVNSIYTINSGYNFLVEIVCRDNLDMVNWIEGLKNRFSMDLNQFQVLKTEDKEMFVPEFGGEI